MCDSHVKQNGKRQALIQRFQFLWMVTSAWLSAVACAIRMFLSAPLSAVLPVPRGQRRGSGDAGVFSSCRRPLQSQYVLLFVSI